MRQGISNCLAERFGPRSIATTYVRNGFGEVIREASPDSGITDYGRDALGNVTQMTDGRGIVTLYSYDPAGRMTSKTYPAAPAEDIAYGWDSTAANTKGLGRLFQAAHQSGHTSWLYDGRGNVTRENRAMQGKTYATVYQYDTADDVTKITYPSGRIVTITRNGLGQISNYFSVDSGYLSPAPPAGHDIHESHLYGFVLPDSLMQAVNIPKMRGVIHEKLKVRVPAPDGFGELQWRTPQ